MSSRQADQRLGVENQRGTTRDLGAIVKPVEDVVEPRLEVLVEFPPLLFEQIDYVPIAGLDALDLVTGGHVLLDEGRSDPSPAHCLNQGLVGHRTLAYLGETLGRLSLEELLNRYLRVLFSHVDLALAPSQVQALESWALSDSIPRSV